MAGETLVWKGKQWGIGGGVSLYVTVVSCKIHSFNI